MSLTELEILTLGNCSGDLIAKAVALEAGLENYFLLNSYPPSMTGLFVLKHSEMDPFLYASVHNPEVWITTLGEDEYGIEFGKTFDPAFLEPTRLAERMKLLREENPEPST